MQKFNSVHFRKIRELAESKRDSEAVVDFNETFGLNLTASAFTKMRQRAKIKKKHGRGVCEIDQPKDG